MYNKKQRDSAVGCLEIKKKKNLELRVLLFIEG